MIINTVWTIFSRSPSSGCFYTKLQRETRYLYYLNMHWRKCVKIVRIWSYSGPHFPEFALNMQRYSLSLRIQSECGKMRTIITPNTDPFYAVVSTYFFHFFINLYHVSITPFRLLNSCRIGFLFPFKANN